MNEEVFCRKNVSFTGHVNKDGQIIKTIGFTLLGEVSFLNINSIEFGSEKNATVSCTDGELYFVPFESLVFLKEKE